MLSLQQRESAVNGANLLMAERSLTSEVQINNLHCICKFDTARDAVSDSLRLWCATISLWKDGYLQKCPLMQTC